MKNRFFFVFFTLISISTLYLPNTFAQNPTRWSLPEGAIARFGKGPATKIIAFSPDGTQFAISWKTGIWIYDAETYQETALFTFEETTQFLRFAFSPDGKTLAASRGGETRLWDIATGQHKQTLNSGWAHITFSPDNKTLAIGHRLWDVSTGGYLKRAPSGYSSSREYSVFSSDGKTLAGFGGSNSNIFLWDTSTDQVLWLKGHQELGH